MDKDHVFGEQKSDEGDRYRQVEALSDSELLQYHSALHATTLIEDTTWAPLIEREMFRRGLIRRQ